MLADSACGVAKEVFYHRNSNILKLWEWLNDEKQLFLLKFNYISKHLYLEKKFNHWDVLSRAIFSPNMHMPTKHTHDCYRL